MECTRQGMQEDLSSKAYLWQLVPRGGVYTSTIMTTVVIAEEAVPEATEAIAPMGTTAETVVGSVARAEPQDMILDVIRYSHHSKRRRDDDEDDEQKMDDHRINVSRRE